MKMTLLGTGTCQLQIERMASSVLIEFENFRVVYDMGRGITQRITQLGLKNDDIEHVVLSHFHPDHISDLIPLLQASSWSRTDPRSRTLHIYGPVGVKVQIMRLISLFGPDELTRTFFEVEIHEIREESFEINGRKFEFVDLPPANNHGLRFTANNKVYALTGDSSFHEQEVAFLEGVDVAVIDSGHPTDEEIVELAVRSQAKKIVCSHLYRELDAVVLQEQAKRKGYQGQFVIGKDLMVIT